MVSSLCACSNSDKVTDEMFALDTIITFSVYDNNKALAKETIDKCKREITRLEKLFSATLEGSDVYNINHSNGEKISVSYETATLIKRALAMSKSCDGAFDISVYPLVKLWGFDSKKYNVPVYCGEFGISTDCFKDGANGTQWVRDILDIFLENGVNFNYHAFHEEMFGLYMNWSYSAPDKLNIPLSDLFTEKLKQR